jgi:hypothetical protein
VQSLAEQVELKTSEARPNESFWQDLDKSEFLKNSINRHNLEGCNRTNGGTERGKPRR